MCLKESMEIWALRFQHEWTDGDKDLKCESKVFFFFFWKGSGLSVREHSRKLPRFCGMSSSGFMRSCVINIAFRQHVLYT